MRCDTEYELGESLPWPRGAHFAVIYWGKIWYTRKKEGAENKKASLDYYQQEDARIINKAGEIVG